MPRSSRNLSLLIFIAGLNCAGPGVAVVNPTPDGSADSGHTSIEPALFSSALCQELAGGRHLAGQQAPAVLSTVPERLANKAMARNIAYQSAQGWDPELNMLDVIYTSDSASLAAAKKPVIVIFHGGGFDGTDRSELEKKAAPLFDHAIARGMVVVNANYRLYHSDRSPKTTAKMQVQDAAQAVRWTIDSIAAYGGDASQIILVGFSHSAHFVALLGTDFSYLSFANVSVDRIKGFVSLDVPHYNIPLAWQLVRGTHLAHKPAEMSDVYGATREEQLSISPVSFLDSNPNVKPALLISTGMKDGKRQDVSYGGSVAFLNEMLARGFSVKHYHFPDLSHPEVFNGFTAPGDPIASAFDQFVDRVLVPKVECDCDDQTRFQAIFDKIESTYSANLTSSGAVNSIPGVVVGYIEDGVSMLVSCGVSRVDEGQRPNASTLFSIGSVTKSMTGLMTASLVKRGEVRLDDTAVSLISDANISSRFHSGITLRHLITHTAGLQQMPGNLMSPRDVNGDSSVDAIDPLNPADHYSVSDLVACFDATSDDPWGRCQPRLNQVNKYGYSNLGIGIAALAIIDRGSQATSSFGELFRNAFTYAQEMSEAMPESDELKRISSVFESQDASNIDIQRALTMWRQRQASRVNYGSIATREAPIANMGILAGAGEVVMSPTALGSYLRLLLGLERSLQISPEDVAEARRELFTDGTHSLLGYAVDIVRDGAGTISYEKTGATAGSSSFITWSPDGKKGLFALMNRSWHDDFLKGAREIYLSAR